MILFPVVPPTPTPVTAEQVMNQLASFAKSAKSLSVDIALSSPKAEGPGKATVTFVRPSEINFTFDWPATATRYRFVGGPKGAWDANLDSKVYDDIPDWRKLERPYSRVSKAPNAFFPDFLLSGDLKGEGVRELKYVGREQINGKTVDHIHGQGRFVESDLYVAIDGRPQRYVVNRQGNALVTGDFSNYQVNTSPSPAVFGMDPPTGFLEASVPFGWRPLGIEEAFPLTGWRVNGGEDLQKGVSGKPIFLEVTQTGCEPSERSAVLLSQLKSTGLAVAVITLDPAGAAPQPLASFPTYYDPSGALTQKLNVPGTPVFYLLGKGGTIVKVWYGYNPDSIADFGKDIADTVKNGYANGT